MNVSFTCPTLIMLIDVSFTFPKLIDVSLNTFLLRAQNLYLIEKNEYHLFGGYIYFLVYQPIIRLFVTSKYNF